MCCMSFNGHTTGFDGYFSEFIWDPRGKRACVNSHLQHPSVYAPLAACRVIVTYSGNQFYGNVFKRGVIPLVIPTSCDCCCFVLDKSCHNSESTANRVCHTSFPHSENTVQSVISSGISGTLLPHFCVVLCSSQTYKPSTQALFWLLTTQSQLSAVHMPQMLYFHGYIFHLYILTLHVKWNCHR